MTRAGKALLQNVFLVLLLFGVVTILFCPWHAEAREKQRRESPTVYWMSVSTEKSGFPGMPSGMPLMRGMLGGGGHGSGKRLQLQLSAPGSLPDEPSASHDIPPGLDMGNALPLYTQEIERGEPGERGRHEAIEKPKMRVLIYWGCSETVRPGQPYIIDTERMNPSEFARVMGGRGPSIQNPPSHRTGWTYAEWPSRKDNRQVPGNGSLVGNHFIHGNRLTDIRFSIGDSHDFMAPVEFTSLKGSHADSFTFQWRSVPTATGYFATAMGHDKNGGTMIIWSSSEAREPGHSFMNFLSGHDVRRFINERVIMPPSVTQCTIPRGVFKEAEGAMIQFIAYGDELNISYPPWDRAKPREPIWTVKMRRKSTSMLPLMEMEGQPLTDPGSMEDREKRSPRKDEITPGKVLRGIFGL